MEDLTLAARNVLMTILPQFLHFVISYCKWSLNLGKTYWEFIESSLSYVEKSGKLNRSTYTGRMRRFHDLFYPHSSISWNPYLNWPLILKEPRWKFTKTSLSYVRKSEESNVRIYTGRTKRFDDYITPIHSFRDILLEESG